MHRGSNKGNALLFGLVALSSTDQYLSVYEMILWKEHFILAAAEAKDTVDLSKLLFANTKQFTCVLSP